MEQQPSAMRAAFEILANLIVMLAARGIITGAEVLMLAAIAERHTRR